MNIYLRPTSAIDCDTPAVSEKAREISGENLEISEKARSLFYFVRDGIKYNPYVPSDKPEHFQASMVLQAGHGFCIQKAVLITALARAIGIPARLRFAAIRNHLLPDKMKQLLGGDYIPDHGYSELYIGEKWVKVAPTFDAVLCQKNKFITVEFDGEKDAILPDRNQDDKKHIEYVKDRGHYDDLPFDDITAWRFEALGTDIFERIRQAVESSKLDASSREY